MGRNKEWESLAFSLYSYLLIWLSSIQTNSYTKSGPIQIAIQKLTQKPT
jgi:hypothetical protein